MEIVVRFWLALLVCSPLACSAPAEEGSHEQLAGAAGHATDGSVELGVPGGEDGLEFVPLNDGSQLKLQTFGQGGTHLMVGVRCTGFGNRTFISATLENLTTGASVSEPAPARPQLLYCNDDGVCDLVPYLVHASGITAPDEDKHGVRLRLTAHARNEAGSMAEGSRDVVLSTEDL